ncbi:MAG: hypothetical protein AAF437_08680 [Pseudomonadota bacterium]
MTYRTLVFAAVATTLAQTAAAQDDSTNIFFGGQNWDVQAERAEHVTHLGKSALLLEKGLLFADDANFSDGVIEFNVSYPEHRAFIGAAWRTQNREDAEEMYFRAHLNDLPDSIQYTPVNNRLSAWQIFSDENAIAPIKQNYDGWNAVKIVVEGDRADIYFNSESPVLHVPDLKNDFTAGGLFLRSTNRGDNATHFADLSIRPLGANEGIVGTPKPSKPMPEGIIDRWQVSSAFAEADIAAMTELPDQSEMSWQTLDVESNGIANLAKLHNPRENGDTVFVKTTLNADRAKISELKFGFSDRVRLYLNGQLIYAGDDGFRTRDYRFLGLVGFYDVVGLHLRPGENELVAAVSETFGGWAWAGAIAPD